MQSGLWLLQQALNFLRTSVTNTALHSHIDNSVRNLLSVNAVLRSLNIQVSQGRDRRSYRLATVQISADWYYLVLQALVWELLVVLSSMQAELSSPLVSERYRVIGQKCGMGVAKAESWKNVSHKGSGRGL